MMQLTRQPWGPAWRAALRLAWRDARRSPARSLLVVALIGLPVFALAGGDSLARTLQLSVAERADRQLGGTDALLTLPGAGQIEQDPSGQNYQSVGTSDAAATPTTSGLAALLPPGSRILPVVQGNWTLRTRFGVKNAQADDLDVTDPHTAPLVRVESGRTARATGEITLSPALARSTGLAVGDTVRTVNPDRSERVVGIVADRYTPDAEVVRVAPGTLAGLTPASERLGLMYSWYVVAPGGVDWSRVLRLNDIGLVVVSRAVVLNPPPRSAVPYYRHSVGGSSRTQEISALALIGGMVLLEIVLLAGPAFAVGARRSRRALALVAATGGTRADLRRIVLSGGLVLGLAAGVLGTVLGAAVGLGLAPLVGRWTGDVPGHLDLRPLELLLIVAVSVVTGLIAAYLPARSAARTDVLAALRGRRDRTRPRRSTPVLGGVLLLAGAVVAIGGTAVLRSSLVILAGAAIAELGVLFLTPSLLGLVGRAARFLPVSGRIALRDTARNRSSAAPAVAAIMAAVTGGVAVAVVVASLREHDRTTYQEALPHGYALLQGAPQYGSDSDVAAQVQRALGARGVAVLHGLDQEADAHGVYHYASLVDHGSGNTGTAFSPVLVDDGSALATIAGRSDPAAVAALRSGRAVVFDPRYAADGRVEVDLGSGDGSGQDTSRRVSAPAVVARATYPLASVVVPAPVARQWGLTVGTVGFLAATRAVPTDRQQQAAGEIAIQYGLGSPQVEMGYRDDYRIGLLILLAVSAVITLGSATISTGLSAVDSRPDLVTLAAIGAPPRVRRRLAAARATVISLTGAGLGVVVGMIAPIGYLELRNRLGGPNHIAVTLPWTNLVGTVVVVPLLAMAGAYLFSRSRLPVERATG